MIRQRAREQLPEVRARPTRRNKKAGTRAAAQLQLNVIKRRLAAAAEHAYTIQSQF